MLNASQRENQLPRHTLFFLGLNPEKAEGGTNSNLPWGIPKLLQKTRKYSELRQKGRQKLDSSAGTLKIVDTARMDRVGTAWDVGGAQFTQPARVLESWEVIFIFLWLNGKLLKAR